MSLRRFLSVLLLSALALCAPSLLSAQDSGEFRAEEFSGYSGYRLGGTVNGAKVPDFRFGWANQFIVSTGSATAFVVDVNGHYGGSGSAQDLAFGPRFQHRFGHFIPFMEALAGVQHFSPKGFPSQYSPTYIIGAGMDIRVNSRFSVRPIQISLVETNYTALFSSQTLSNYFTGIRVQAGLVYNLRGRSSSPQAQAEVTASCIAEPPAVDSGIAVKIGVTANGFPPMRKLRYSYESTGGAITGNSAKEFVDTKGTAPGTYTVRAKVADNGKGRHQQTASCDATFSVNAQRPSAPSVATDEAKQQQPAAPPEPTKSAEVSAAPEPTKSAEVSAASEPTKSAEVSAPPALVQTPEAAKPLKPSKFGAIGFRRDRKHPTRVDDEAKGELDRYAVALDATPELKGVVVGHAGVVVGHAGAKKNRARKMAIAAQRALNTKAYLTGEKGIDGARIASRIGGANRRNAELWIVPSGARFATKGTRVVDKRRVRTLPRIPLKAGNAQEKLHKQVHERVGKST